jgi:hypothetical protein
MSTSGLLSTANRWIEGEARMTNTPAIRLPSLIALVQPVIANKLPGNEVCRGKALLARFLSVAESVRSTRLRK